jgi:hypothetical protein
MSKENEFSNLSIELTKYLSKEVKKEGGIFFTPKTIIKKFVEKIDFTYIKNILEPSCGSCEIIDYLDKLNDYLDIDGIEINNIIYEKIKLIQFKNKINIINQDFTKYNTDKKYDLIIGNPPYFVCNKEIVPNEYKNYIIGRPNIFCIFILHSLTLLSDNGIMAFIIPNSFLNSYYYSSIREHLIQNGNILNIIDFEKDNKFIDTQQTTIGLIFQKTNNKTISPYSLKIENNYIFTGNLLKLHTIFEGSTTLQKLGLNVKTGNIVWNEKKELLTNDNTKTMLIYNSNITKNNELNIMEFSNKDKKQYINLTGSIEPIIVVNRGNGNSKYKLNYSIIELNKPYLVENHLNIIYPTNKTLYSSIELLNLYNKILISFQNPKTLLFIKEFLGNNSLSKTELLTIFPIFI